MQRRGITLIEVSVLLLLLVLLLSVILPAIVKTRGLSQRTELTQRLRSMGEKIRIYEDVHGHLPADVREAEPARVVPAQSAAPPAKKRRGWFTAAP